MRFVSGQQWGARPPKSAVRLTPSRITELVFHYSASDADEQADHRNCARRVKGIQDFHTGPSRGWNDLAYSFLVCKHGFVFEGRGWNVRTAATGNANDHTLAVCFLGDDRAGRDDVTNAGRQALVDIARAFVARYGSKRFSGHRDHMSTSCPGDEIHGFIRSRRFRELVERPADPKLWPIPIPSWFWAFSKWHLSGRKGPRPAVVPARIPDWAWRRLRALERGHR